MSHLKALVMMQLRDKLDMSFVKSRKLLIRKIVFTVLRFAIVAAAAYIVRMLLGLLMFSNSDTPQLMIVVVTFLIGISCITCMIELVKSLYFADDNRVLITFPVGGNVIFVSKIIVCYFYELVKEYLLIVPILLGMGIYSINILTPWFIPWLLLVWLIVPALPVLIGALLSIPSLFVARFVNRHPIVKVALFAVIIGLVVWGLAVLISLLPENIDLINQGNTVIRNIRTFLLDFEKAVVPASMLVYLITGKKTASLSYNIFVGRTFLILGGLILLIALLFGIAFFVSRPLFFTMMSKSFEFEKKSTEGNRKNKKRGKWATFVHKEFKLCIANEEVFLPFLATYIAVPLLIYLLNKLYAAMNTRLAGQVMTYAFNLLIILLPLLASNAAISKLYSKEGRAGYIKKTKPIDILMPIFAKLIFFIVLSIPSIAVTTMIFGSFVSDIFKWYDLLMLFFMVLFIQYGHILFSALLDMMNPQNEQYATVGDSVHNPNETRSTIVAFALSFFFAGFGYMLFKEVTLSTQTVTLAVVKLLAIATVLLGAMISLFIKCVRAYYYEK